jgi:DNA-binding CsgD family transcriptional regulator/PAS domain-containing protein
MTHTVFPLSSADVGDLQASFLTLLSPFDHPTVDAWRVAVNRTLRPLFGADMATFAMPPSNGKREYLSEQIDYDALKPSYPEWLEMCEPQFRTIERAVALGAFSRKMLYLPNWSWFHRSAYYNDFVVPLRAYDSIGIHVRAGRENRVCCLLFHHERPTGKRFGRRGIALARLILPVFKSAVRTCLHLREHHADVSSAIDGLSDGVVLADSQGRPLHQNPALGEMLAFEPDRDRLGKVIGDVAVALSRFAALPAKTDEGALRGPVSRALDTACASYRVSASYLAGSHAGDDTVVLVTVQRATSSLPSQSIMRERFSLTKRECQVAEFLARGKSDAAIARALGISAHTARHHAENVRLRLGVHSREDVETALRRPGGAPAPALRPHRSCH